MGRLWEQLTSFPNLLTAASRAQRGKRTRPNVSVFRLDLEAQLLRLQEELRTHTYHPGRYRSFIVYEKKPRLISAAPFRDRVVHHALCNIIEPIFDRAFLFDSYACRKGKGTHAAVERASLYARRFQYVLKCDVEKYFPSIDHAILFERIERTIWDQDVLWLVRLIIDESPPQPPVMHYFPGDAWWTPFDRARGIPIGNQTSQFFANVYLDGLDHFAKETLRLPGYIRYVDDFLVFHQEKAVLHEVQQILADYCEGLRLRLHPRKCLVAPIAKGFSFLGYRMFPTHRRIDTGNVRRFKRRLRGYRAAVASGTLPVDTARACVQSWEAHASHADTVRLRQHLLASEAWLWPDGEGVGPIHASWRLVEQSTDQHPFCEPEQEYANEP